MSKLAKILLQILLINPARATEQRSNTMETYKELNTRQSKEINTLPIFWAFSNKQFEEGMAQFGLEKTDTGKIYRLDSGGYYKRTDSSIINELFERHPAELKAAIAADTTGEGFIFDMFDYELGNHEFTYTGDTEDTLDALGFTMEEIEKSPALSAGLKMAITAQYAYQG